MCAKALIDFEGLSTDLVPVGLLKYVQPLQQLSNTSWITSSSVPDTPAAIERLCACTRTILTTTSLGRLCITFLCSRQCNQKHSVKGSPANGVLVSY